MASMTLLEITQDILNDLEEDVVNSINDSVAALEVAQIIKTTYNNIIDSKDWPHLQKLFQFTALGNVNKPNYLEIPSDIVKVNWIKYNVHSSTETKNVYREIYYKEPEVFMEYVNQRNSDNTNIQIVQDSSGVVMNILNDKAPQYYTSFDDVYIICDSFDNAVDTTLQASKSSGFGRKVTTFTLSDTFVADLPSQMFTYLLNEAKATAFIVLKQTANPKAQEHSTTQRRRMSQDAWKVKSGISYPSYGRK
jgi:hypothetical protein